MEKTRRRLWAWAVSLGAGLVILAAAASGLFQIAVQAVPRYRADVEAELTRMAGRPIRVERLGLTWRYYYPSVDLIGVALLDGQGAPLLEARRLRLGFGLLDLARGSRLPDRIDLEGLTLEARRDESGAIRVRGFPPFRPGEGGADNGAVLEALERFAQLRLTECRLVLRDDRRGPQAWPFSLKLVRLDRTLLGHRLRAEVGLPPLLGESAELESSFSGALARPAGWKGSFSLELERLVARTAIESWLARGAQLDATELTLALSGGFEGGSASVVDARLKSSGIAAERAGHRANLDSLDVRVHAVPAEGGWTRGWRAELRKLAIETASGRWPGSEGRVEWSRPESGVPSVEAALSFLRLGDVAPWLQIVDTPPTLAALSGARGDVEDLKLTYEAGDEPRYGYRARFMGLGVPFSAGAIAGLRGELAGDETGGRAVLQRSAPVLELPGALLTPSLPLEDFEAEAEWRRSDAGWHVGLPSFRWALWGLRGKGEFGLELPRGERASPSIDLHAAFLAEDVTRAKGLMPTHWSAGLRGWLDRAILAGRVPRAELTIRGPLSDFPYQEKQTGLFALDIEAEAIDLAFLPDWPSAEGVAASLAFRGNSLDVRARSGRLGAARVREARARFPDFHTAQLLIDGTVDGDMTGFYEVVLASPLRELLKGLVTRSRARGPGTVTVNLDVPLHESTALKVGGSVTLDGVELEHEASPAPVREIRGTIEFGGPGLRAQGLSGKIWDIPLTAAIAPQAGGGGELTAEFTAAIDPAGGNASALIPGFIRQRVSGTAQWRGSLAIGGDSPAVFTLRSDLAGIAVDWPPPLGKPAAEPRAFTLTVGGASPEPLRITAEYQDRLGADLRFRRGPPLTLERGALRIGAGSLFEPAEAGLVLAGQLDTLDLEAWLAELQRGSLRAGGDSPIRRADLHVGKLQYRRWAVRDARYQWAAQKDGGWSVSAIGAGAIGELRWFAEGAGRLRARLDQLGADVIGDVPEPKGGEPFDPNKFPSLDLDVARLQIEQTDFGHVVFLTDRTELGQKIRTAKAEGASLNATVQGEWRRRAGQSSGSFKTDATTSAPDGLLRAIGIAPDLTARSGKIAGDLRWAPVANGLDWQDARGTAHIEFENGQLRELEPGAGRVLGLFNFYALPRRLSLNFKDVTGAGLGFDRLVGDFQLADGNARTENLQLTAPSLRMELRGRVGLRARDYDQQVSVYPGVSSGVTLGATLLGGPVAGVLTLIAQQLLNKPLDQVSELSYRVTGSWDNPQVERAGGSNPPPPERTPGSPSQK